MANMADASPPALDPTNRAKKKDAPRRRRRKHIILTNPENTVEESEQQLTWQQQALLAPPFVPANKRTEQLQASHQQSRRQNSSQEGALENKTESDMYHPSCVLCCNTMKEVAIGPCNHREICATCCLRLRLCYDSTECSLCKSKQPSVVIALWRKNIPSWNEYKTKPHKLARSKNFANGTVAADTWQPIESTAEIDLLWELRHRTSLSCVLCNRIAKAKGTPFPKPFPNRQALKNHYPKSHHGHKICELCLEHAHLFPLELDIYKNSKALKRHLDERHPSCDFCKTRFYDKDALWQHMQRVHFSCHVCPSSTAAYYNTARDLADHMRHEHHMCEEPECIDCFVAFSTLDELRRHHLDRHSARMPRWNSATARPLPLDGIIAFPRRDRGTGLGRQRNGDTRMPRPSLGRGTVMPPEEEGQEGAIIDDDLGMLDLDDESFRRRVSNTRNERRTEDFPSLQQTLSSCDQGITTTTTSNNGNGNRVQRRRPPLVKQSMRCGCGRQVVHFVVEQGQSVPAVDCDAVCSVESRRTALARAFGVEDPQSHLSSFDRNRRRDATYSGELLAAAKVEPAFIKQLEMELSAFVLDEARSKRRVLPAMVREHRALAHQLAEQYGMATQSVGHEPKRSVELFRTDTTSLPKKTLSVVATTVTDQEVAELMAEAAKHSIRLYDVALTADVRYYLRRWDGGYTMEWEPSGTAVVIQFEQEEDKKDVLNSLGGGIRGLFLVDRSYAPRTSLSSADVPHTCNARGWGTSNSSGGVGSGWNKVAASKPEDNHGTEEEVEEGEQNKKAGWAVINKKCKPRVMAQQNFG